MSKYQKLIGTKINHWFIKGPLRRSPKNKYCLELFCICTCGKQSFIYAQNIVHGKSKSCGCQKPKPPIIWKHRMSRSKTYKTWRGILSRCINPTNPNDIKNYKNKGITVSKRWMKFENFLQDMGIKPDGMTIERINNKLGYSKKNCKWATMKEQAQNKSSNIRYKYNGKIRTIPELIELTGLSRHAIYSRIRRNVKLPHNI